MAISLSLCVDSGRVKIKFSISFLVLVMLMAVIGITFREFKSVNNNKKSVSENVTNNASEYDLEDLEEMKFDKNDSLGYYKKMKKISM